MSTDPTALATTVALQEGALALDSGDATTALEHIERALALDPGSPAAARLRALALARLACATPDPSPTPPPPTEAPWAPGELVEGRWEVFGSAQGGMGRVYFVRDQEWGALELAVKSLVPRAGAGAAEVARAEGLFRREARVWLDLGAHPHIVSGFYTVTVRGALRFFMEYVPGTNLDAVARRAGGRLAPADAVDLAIQLASGVEHLHARGVVHRDLKPANCLVMADGTLRLTDFGLGKAAAERDAVAVAVTPAGAPAGVAVATALGLSVAGAGTPLYMAPEQWRSLAEAGPPADVYAFGALLYELLAGAAPFDTAPEHLARFEKLPPRAQRALDRGASRSLVLWLLHAEAHAPALAAAGVAAPMLEELVRACLAKAPEERPTIAVVRDALFRAWRALTGADYARELPGALPPTETGESNRAVSYFVMGDVDRARAILDAWLDAHPAAPHAWVNRQSMALALGEAAAPRVALAFERDVAPVHPAMVDRDPHVAAFRARLRRHAPWTRGPVEAVAFRPDGALLALGAGEVVALVRPDDGALVAALEGHAAGVTALAFDPAGARLVSTSYDRTARVWDARAGLVHRVLEGHRDCVVAGVFDPAGARVLTGGGASYKRVDRMARVWDVAAGALVQTLRGHAGELADVAWSPDGALCATASADGTAGLWDPRTGTLVYAFEPEGARVPLVSVAFADGGRRLVVARRDGRVFAWATDSGQLALAFASPGALVTAAAVGLDGLLVATGHEDGRVRVVDVTTGEAVRDADTAGGRVLALAFSPDGARLAVGCEAGAQVWDVDPGAAPRGHWPLVIDPPLSARGLLGRARERAKLESRLAARDLSSYRPLQALRARTPEYQRDAGLVASLHRAASGGGCRVAARDAWVVDTLDLDAPVLALAFGDDGRAVQVGVGSATGLATRAWTPATGAVAVGSAVEAGAASAAAFSPDGRYVLVGREGGALALGRTSTGRVVRRLAEGGNAITAAAFSADGALAITGDAEGVTRVWDVARGEALRSLRGHRHGVAAVALGADGALALTGAWDRTARLWDVATGRCLRVFAGHAAGVGAVAFDPEARRVLTAGDDGAALWSTGDGARIAALDAHPRGVTAVAFSHDGRLALTGGWDDAVRVWRAADGGPWCALGGHAHGVTALAASPDGLSLATGGAEQTVRLWVLDAEWAFAEELVPDAAGLFEAEPSSRYWPHAAGAVGAGGAAAVDAWLDVWRDVRHAGARSGLATDLAAGAESLRERLLDRLAEAAAGARSDGSGDTDDGPGDPVWRAARVDAALAADLAARLRG